MRPRVRRPDDDRRPRQNDLLAFIDIHQHALRVGDCREETHRSGQGDEFEAMNHKAPLVSPDYDGRAHTLFVTTVKRGTKLKESPFRLRYLLVLTASHPFKFPKAKPIGNLG